MCARKEQGAVLTIGFFEERYIVKRIRRLHDNYVGCSESRKRDSDYAVYILGMEYLCLVTGKEERCQRTSAEK
jgi:hypothetical protein